MAEVGLQINVWDNTFTSAHPSRGTLRYKTERATGVDYQYRYLSIQTKRWNEDRDIKKDKKAMTQKTETKQRERLLKSPGSQNKLQL